MAKQEVIVADPKAVIRLRDFISTDTVRQKIAAALPKHLSAERMIAQAVTLARNTPGLVECTEISVLSGIMKAAELGLELSGPLGQAWLIPRWNSKARCKEASFQIGYKGAMSLAYRSGLVLSITPRVVRVGDSFGYAYGTEHNVTHHPREAAPGEPEAEATHYYAVAKMQGGGLDFEVWTKAQVVAHRNRFAPPPKDKTDYSAWATSFDAMACKTVLCCLARRLPVSVEFQEALASDVEAERVEVVVRPPAERLASKTEEILAKLDGPPAPADEYQGDHTIDDEPADRP